MRMTAANHGIDHFRQLLASDALMSRLEYVLLWPDFHLDLVRLTSALVSFTRLISKPGTN